MQNDLAIIPRKRKFTWKAPHSWQSSHRFFKRLFSLVDLSLVHLSPEPFLLICILLLANWSHIYVYIYFWCLCVRFNEVIPFQQTRPAHWCSSFTVSNKESRDQEEELQNWYDHGLFSQPQQSIIATREVNVVNIRTHHDQHDQLIHCIHQLPVLLLLPTVLLHHTVEWRAQWRRGHKLVVQHNTSSWAM